MIVEKKLGITADYQYKAINSKNFLQSNWHKNKLTAIYKLITTLKNKHLLDLGPGSGNLELNMAAQCDSITAVDYNDEAVEFLSKMLNEQNITNVDLHVKDIVKLSELNLNKKYDLITMIDVIEHLQIEDAKKLVEYFPSLLNEGGKVLIITPNYKSAWVLIEKLLDKVSIVPKFAGEQHLAKFHYNNLNDMFTSSGFNVENFRTFNYFSFLAPFPSIAKRLCELELSIPFKNGNLIAAVYSKK